MRTSYMMLAAGLLAASPSAAIAQSEAPGLPFVGCWQPIEGFATDRLCMTVEDGGTLGVHSLSADGKVTESTLSLDGRRVEVTATGCSGWEEGRLTRDRERLIIRAEVRCGDEPQQLRETAFAITPSGHLMQGVGMGLAQVASTQLRLFSPVRSYADVPPALRERLMPHLVRAERARLEIRENAVSATDLVELERLAVASPLIDLMVAASYPKSFVIDGAGAVDGVEKERVLVERPMTSAMFMNGYPMLGFYDWQMMYECMRIGFGCGGSYFGFRYNSWQNYGYAGWPYGYGYNGMYVPGYGIPVVVRPAPVESGGRAVRGRGYTQGSNGSSGSATPRASTTRSGTGASARASGGSSSGSSGGRASGGSSSGSTGRTAKPRP